MIVLFVDANSLRPFRFRKIENLLRTVPEEVHGRGAAGDGQVFPQDLLPVHQMPKVVGPGRILQQGRRLLLHRRLPALVRHEMRGLQSVRGGRGGVHAGQDVPPEVFHLQQVQESL